MNIALIVFAGSGTRITSSIPKQFIKIKGHELVAYTINAFNIKLTTIFFTEFLSTSITSKLYVSKKKEELVFK